MNLCKKCTSKPYSVLVTTLSPDNSLRFRKNIVKRIKKLIITIDDKINEEKLQCDINRKATKMLALCPCKIDKSEYVTGKDILPSDQSRKIQQGMFTYSPLSRAFEKQIKTIEDQGGKFTAVRVSLKRSAE